MQAETTLWVRIRADRSIRLALPQKQPVIGRFDSDGGSICGVVVPRFKASDGMLDVSDVWNRGQLCGTDVGESSDALLSLKQSVSGWTGTKEGSDIVGQTHP